MVCFVHIWQSLALILLGTLDERAVDYGKNNLHLDFEPPDLNLNSSDVSKAQWRSCSRKDKETFFKER